MVNWDQHGFNVLQTSTNAIACQNRGKNLLVTLFHLEANPILPTDRFLIVDHVLHSSFRAGCEQGKDLLLVRIFAAFFLASRNSPKEGEHSEDPNGQMWKAPKQTLLNTTIPWRLLQLSHVLSKRSSKLAFWAPTSDSSSRWCYYLQLTIWLCDILWPQAVSQTESIGYPLAIHWLLKGCHHVNRLNCLDHVVDWWSVAVGPARLALNGGRFLLRNHGNVEDQALQNSYFIDLHSLGGFSARGVFCNGQGQITSTCPWPRNGEMCSSKWS